MSAHAPGVTDLQVLNIPKIRCGGCVAGVEKAIHAVDASAAVKADIEARRVEVTTAAGYPAEAV